MTLWMLALTTTEGDDFPIVCMTATPEGLLLATTDRLVKEWAINELPPKPQGESTSQSTAK
jgi:hypothetical protein